ncbi:MAG: DUF2130 domain-containing protein, partial [Verrucomicrobiales bacterium]
MTFSATLFRMNEGTITCPNCDHQFELSDALRSQIRQQLEGEVKEKLTQREVALKKRADELSARQEALEKSRGEIDEQVARQLRTKSAELEKAAAQKLQSAREELEKARLSLDEELAKKLQAQRAELETQAAEKARAKFESELKDLRAAAAEKDADLKNLREQEMELRKKQRELAREKEEAELAMQRKLDAEREAIAKQVSERLAEEHRLKDLEKEQLIRSLRSSVEDLKRKSEQGSMESQGEALEIDLEEQIQQLFPHDLVTPVSKGVRGADIIQQVRNPVQQDCGIILWETKNTKSWSEAWLAKFKDDMQEKRAVLGILVSVALPAGLKRFGRVDGVWVSDPASALPLATALREQLLVLQREQLASVGKNEKMELLYQYLAGTQFQQKITG